MRLIDADEATEKMESNLRSLVYDLKRAKDTTANTKAEKLEKHLKIESIETKLIDTLDFTHFLLHCDTVKNVAKEKEQAQ